MQAIATKYGLSPTTLSFLSHLLRLEGFYFDVPKLIENSLCSTRLQNKYSKYVRRAIINQVKEVVFNGANRLLSNLGLGVKPLALEKIRAPLVLTDGFIKDVYGPGKLPFYEELEKEKKAVRLIERWWTRKKKGVVAKSNKTKARWSWLNL